MIKEKPKQSQELTFFEKRRFSGIVQSEIYRFKEQGRVMVRIRFRRVGLKKQPSYRIVVADQRKSRNGGIIENIGHHNARTQPDTDVIDDARALYWLSVGAQPTDGVLRLMKRTGTWERFERLNKGEEMEVLVAEAVSPVTSHPAPAAGESKRKALAAALAATEAAEADEEEPAAEAEAAE
jgi:small subunit ribosomal protein S16